MRRQLGTVFKVWPGQVRFLLGLALFAVFGVSVVWAHPHVFVEARSSLVFGDQGEAVGVRHVFRFDDAFSAFAIQGFDKNNDGVYSREELAELADVNIESMADFGYFTFGDNTRVELDFETPTDYWLEVVSVPLTDYWVMKPEDFEAIQEDIRMNGGSAPEDVTLLELHFTLPLKEPADATAAITLDVYDPTYYVDFRFGREDDALAMVNAPGNCQITRKEPPPLDDATAYALAQIGPDQRDLPPELQSAAASQINQMIVTCAAVASSPSPQPAKTDGENQNRLASAATPETADKAVEMLVAEGSGNAPGNRSAEVLETTQQTMVIEPGLSDQFFGSIAQMQKDFYQRLVASLRAFRSNPNAFWLLVGLSFAYGVFHAAGPGHGKAIITSYVVANNETLKKGIVLSFASAFAQALTAIVLVGGLAVVFNLTSIAIQDTARWFEIGSYVMITALGAWLLWQKAGKPMLAGLASRSAAGGLAFAGAHEHETTHSHAHLSHTHHTQAYHAHVHHAETHHHAHGHDHDHHHHIGPGGVCSSCGHAHAPTPDMLHGEITMAKAVSIILAVGLRPCTGALVVLVFALSQGMVAAGIASTLAMAVGTGITVALLAGLAVSAKDLAVRLFGAGSPTAVRIHRAIEILGAAIVFMLGITLLIAAVGWG